MNLLDQMLIAEENCNLWCDISQSKVRRADANVSKKEAERLEAYFEGQYDVLYDLYEESTRHLR